MRRFGFLVAASVLTASACATKEVSLATRDANVGDATDVTGASDATDASIEPVHFPVPFCISFVDSTSAEACMTCYDEWGTLKSRVCKPPPSKCVAREDLAMGARCVYCDDAPAMPRACLKCMAADGANECMSCQWSDSGDVCRRCADAAGTLDSAACDGLRADLRPGP